MWWHFIGIAGEYLEYHLITLSARTGDVITTFTDETCILVSDDNVMAEVKVIKYLALVQRLFSGPMCRRYMWTTGISSAYTQLTCRILAHCSILYSTRALFILTTLWHPTKQFYADIVHISLLFQNIRMLIHNSHVYLHRMATDISFADLQSGYHWFSVNEMCLHWVRSVYMGTYFVSTHRHISAWK